MNAVQVETFECQETASEPIEISEEAAALIGALGMTGQEKFLVNENEKVVARCPYRLMTEEEVAVYKTLCPSAVRIKDYDAAPIPLRVLQIAAHAARVIEKKHRMMIWDKDKHEIKDPVLVAEVGEYDWRPDGVYILARWGSELDTFATLAQMASKMVRERLIAEAKALAEYFEATTDMAVLKNFRMTFPEVAK